MKLRVGIVVALLALTIVPAALALNPAPTVRNWDSYAAGTNLFDTYPDQGYSWVVNDTDSCGAMVATGGFSSPNLIALRCYPELFVSFDSPQAYVAFRVRPHQSPPGGGPWSLTLTAFDANSAAIGSGKASIGDNSWGTIAFNAPGGAASIHFISLNAGQTNGPFYIDVDDFAHSPSSQPDTEITSTPPALTNSQTAAFQFRGNGGTSFLECSRDNAAFTRCSSGQSYSGLGDGQHTFRVRAVNGYGTQDPTPASYTWRIDRTAPDTRIDFGPPASTTSNGANFVFSSPDSDVAGYECRLNTAPFAACTSPLAYANLPDGQHTFDVRARDGLGNVDATPAHYAWTISPPPAGTPREEPAKPPVTLVPVTTTPTVIDPCAAAGQPDADGDGIPNACETLDEGNVAAVSGVNAIVRAVEGDVYVKLPAGAAASYKQAGLEPGFVPLKGVASVPVGSVLDTRKGTASVATAADFRRANDRRHRSQTARFRAGIFRIKQARRKSRRRGAPSRPTTDLVLVSASAAEAKCTAGGAESRKGVVRTISGVGKGRFRTVAGAATVSTTNATWITTDRCDGTVTEVGKGRAAVFDKRRKRTVTVRAGQSYIAKARIFQAKKGRRGA